MTFRFATSEDFGSIVELANANGFALPDPDNLIGIGVVEDDGKIIAAGALEKLIEIVFIPDLYQSNRKVLEAMNLLLVEAVKASKANNIKTIHAFTDEQFSSLLLKHFDFRLRNQTPLTLEISNGKESTGIAS